MNAGGVFANGLRRAWRAPALLLMLWLASLFITIPPAVALHDAITTHLGDSLEADRAADAVNFNWMQEFRAQAGPLGSTLRPDVIGFGAVMDNTSALADVSGRALVVVASGIVFVGLLWFVTPGVIHRLAANRPIGAGPFFGSCGGFAGRMLRLGVVSALVYAMLFGSVHRWLFDDTFDAITRNLTVERTAFFIRVALYIVFFLMVGAVNLLFDFTKVRLVVEDRYSVIGALASAGRFVRANPGVAIGVYAMNMITFALVLAAYAVAAPGAGAAGWTMWGGFLVGQLYIVSRLLVKLAFWGGEIAALQTRFGCPGYVRTRTLGIRP